mmetsp:Transcript_11432/g.18999  ORF Transcript_11432/g.18999 Transcript_11432/m.18999 type:complete len:480 (-) Transcript_11432:47-1486(-)
MLETSEPEVVQAVVAATLPTEPSKEDNDSEEFASSEEELLDEDLLTNEVFSLGEQSTMSSMEECADILVDDFLAAAVAGGELEDNVHDHSSDDDDMITPVVADSHSIKKRNVEQVTASMITTCTQGNSQQENSQDSPSVVFFSPRLVFSLGDESTIASMEECGILLDEFAATVAGGELGDMVHHTPDDDMLTTPVVVNSHSIKKRNTEVIASMRTAGTTQGKYQQENNQGSPPLFSSPRLNDIMIVKDDESKLTAINEAAMLETAKAENDFNDAGRAMLAASQRISRATATAILVDSANISQYKPDKECAPPEIDPAGLNYLGRGFFLGGDNESTPMRTNSKNPNISPSQRLSGLQFPMKLHHLLTENQYPSIISWNSDGMSFTVHDLAQFERTVMPQYFAQQHKLDSFRRQLQRYNFQLKRISPGSGKVAMFGLHEHFIKGHYDLCVRICMHDDSHGGRIETRTTRRWTITTPPMLSS